MILRSVLIGMRRSRLWLETIRAHDGGSVVALWSSGEKMDRSLCLHPSLYLHWFQVEMISCERKEMLGHLKLAFSYGAFAVPSPPLLPLLTAPTRIAPGSSGS